MSEIREEVVETRATPAPPPTIPPMPTMTEVTTAPVRRRWWRRYRVPVEPTTTVSRTTEYVAAPSYELDPAMTRFFRMMWFALGVLETFLGLRFLLALLGANPSNQFASMIYAITGPFVIPFRTLFPVPRADGAVFELYTLIAMAVYFLLWWAIVKFIGVATNRWVDV